ncbi:hypothetical protein Hdeb2414_s0018g00520881 [Helianthus debilis subsp. tardiflorus]
MIEMREREKERDRECHVAGHGLRQIAERRRQLRLLECLNEAEVFRQRGFGSTQQRRQWILGFRRPCWYSDEKLQA